MAMPLNEAFDSFSITASQTIEMSSQSRLCAFESRWRSWRTRATT